jgi:hypothetical protein
MYAPAKTVSAGVKRRRKADVPPTLTKSVSVLRHERNRGQFVIDAVFENFREALERKFLAARLRTG